jgi:nitronate monooxygenase
VNLYVSKSGKPEDAVGKKCVCNALVASIGPQQVRKGNHIERGLVTSGNDLGGIMRFMPPGGSMYTAADVVRTLLNE